MWLLNYSKCSLSATVRYANRSQQKWVIFQRVQLDRFINYYQTLLTPHQQANMKTSLAVALLFALVACGQSSLSSDESFIVDFLGQPDHVEAVSWYLLLFMLPIAFFYCFKTSNQKPGSLRTFLIFIINCCRLIPVDYSSTHHLVSHLFVHTFTASKHFNVWHSTLFWSNKHLTV